MHDVLHLMATDCLFLMMNVDKFKNFFIFSSLQIVIGILKNVLYKQGGRHRSNYLLSWELLDNNITIEAAAAAKVVKK